jgi:hypothetical protein
MSRRNLRPPDRQRSRRPSVEELGGISEYRVRSASGIEEDDPMTSVITPAAQEDDLSEPMIATGQPKGGVPAERLSVPPDEIGAHYLRRAVQEPRPDEPEESPRKEEDEMSAGERSMLDRRPGPVEAEGPLVTSLPARAEVQRQVSLMTERAGREVRTPGRGARIRDQSARVAELRRDEQGESLGPRRRTARRAQPSRPRGRPAGR